MEAKSKQGFNILTVIRYVSLIIIVIILGVFSFNVYQFVQNTTSIYKSSSTKTCSGSDYCLDIKATYDNGWGRWRLPLVNLPVLSFTANSSSYRDGDTLKLTCPMPYQNGDNETIDKIKFIFGQVDINKCSVSKA